MKYTSFFSVALALLASACGNQPNPAESTAEKTAVHPEAGLIHLGTDQVKRAGITWGAVENRAVSTNLALTGELRIHPENRAVVSAFAAGILSNLYTGLNRNVQKGDLIATLRNPELVDLQQQYLENRDKLAFLKTEFERYKTLKDDNATAAKNLQKAEAELHAATTTGQLLAAKLRFYGVDPEKIKPSDIRTELRITAPVSGVVTAVHLSAGTAVQAGAPICEIADFSALHADLFVFEKDILKVKAGQKATLSFPGAPGKILNATVYAVDRMLDPAKNALRIHARIEPGAGLTLTDGAYCDAQLQLDQPVASPALPQDAFVREGLDEYILLLDKEAGGAVYFKALKVKTLGTESGYTAFSPETALPGDARFVRSGAYFVWSQGKVEEFAEEE